ncbi:MAG: hypothetical protein IPJ48_17885 [Propionivibrio sp.]|jgi:hypothetical protein|uniref:Uncharacterized protein n=1 Tax=Candidatus Propionivibrio dominans TaxID=2954373 RepID=A0A9D7FN08_9RHOO|nr:hypothetical protein [Candidatus Propionivibrio dominans]
MAYLTATAMNLRRQQERFTNLPPPNVSWQMPSPFDDEIDTQLRRLMAEQHEIQKMARATTGTVTVPTSISRHNTRLLLCHP